MLSINLIPLSPKEVSSLLRWLSCSEAQLFAQVLECRIAALEAQIGVAMGETADSPGREADAKEAIAQIVGIRNCLTTLKHIKETAGEIGLSSVSVDYVFAHSFATNDTTDPRPATSSANGPDARGRAKGRGEARNREDA